MNLPDMHFEEGLPNASSFDPATRNLVVIDDLMTEKESSQEYVNPLPRAEPVP